MKLKAFEEIDEIDEKIKDLENRRKTKLEYIQSHCGHPERLLIAVNGGEMPDGWGGSNYEEPTRFRCGMCDKYIDRKAK